MSYIFDNTDYVRIICINLSTGSAYRASNLCGYIKYKPIDEDIYHDNLNNEIIVENIGQRMSIEFEIINNSDINSQSVVTRFLHDLNLVKAGTHRFHVWPSYNVDAIESTLDMFDCIVKGYYSIENLVDTVQVGNSITINFVEYSPNKNFTPKVPELSTTLLTVPTEPGGMIIV